MKKKIIVLFVATALFGACLCSLVGCGADAGTKNPGGDITGGESRSLTREQIYTAYKTVGTTLRSQNDGRSMRARNAGGGISTHADEEYELQFTSDMGEYLSKVDHEYVEIDFEYAFVEAEIAIYYNVAEYCSAQDGFEIGVWHNTDPCQYHKQMFIRIWYDEQYIYFCYAIQFDFDDDNSYRFSYSALDYDFDTGDFYYTLYCGNVADLSSSKWSEIERFSEAELISKGGKIHGWLGDGYLDPDGEYYAFMEYDDNGMPVPSKKYGADVENALNGYIEKMKIPEATYNELSATLDSAVNDEHAWNYFVRVADLGQFEERRLQLCSMKAVLDACPAGSFKTYLQTTDGWRELIELAETITEADWVHYSTPQMINELEEILDAPQIKQKTFDDYRGEWNEYDVPVRMFYYNYVGDTSGLKTDFDGYYTDEQCTVALTKEDVLNFEFGVTVVYYKSVKYAY